ncbi:MAG: hypothetical protein WC533_00690 [Candidatus Pacearchaeota archaeon]
MKDTNHDDDGNKRKHLIEVSRKRITEKKDGVTIAFTLGKVGYIIAEKAGYYDISRAIISSDKILIAPLMYYVGCEMNCDKTTEMF